MSLSPVLKINLGGQDLVFNQDSKVVILNIHEPFYSAGKIMSWPKDLGSAGFGVNKEIIKFIIERKLKLLIRCDKESQKEYWGDWSALYEFVKIHNSEYLTNGVWLLLFPWKLFHSKPTFTHI